MTWSYSGRGFALWAGGGVGLFFLALAGLGAEPASATPRWDEFSNLSLEQLVNLEVTSVSKRETKLSQAPTAITVITQEDIRRSGLNSVPELLRLAPGLNVARIDANTWAISSRGFNNQYGNKLLVLVDGRAVYTPAFAGVFWNVQDLMLEDLERIEVIRGPGATLWGANAVNGVINVITKSAKDTQGTLASVTVGTEDQPSVGVRYGAKAGEDLFFRAYVKYADRPHFSDASGLSSVDQWDAARGGLRLDWEPENRSRLTLQGEYYYGHAAEQVQEPILTAPFSQPVIHENRDAGGHLLGRWTKDFSASSQLTVQTYYDRFTQGDLGARETRGTYDLDLQHRFSAGDRQVWVWGAGFRHTADFLPSTGRFVWSPERREEQLYSAFAQDEITLIEQRLQLTVGSKFEHNPVTGMEFQPSARLLWTPTERHSVWGAVSRAVRTPARYERDVRLNFTAAQPVPSPVPVMATLEGNPQLAAETMIAYEVGYRVEPMERVSFDVTGFYNSYDQLQNFEPGALTAEALPVPHLVQSLGSLNSISGQACGAELAAQWQPVDYWRLTASYTRLHMRMPGDPARAASSPQNQFQVRSYLDLPRNWQFNSALYFVDAIQSPMASGSVAIPAHWRVDVGVSWRPTKSLELGLWGQNLGDARHAEFSSYKTTTLTEMGRGVMGKLTWRF